MGKQLEKTSYWRKLDDQAKVFALASNRKYSSIFRLSVLLNDKIELELLKKAVQLALEKYRIFKVKLKRGLFWYYFEENEKDPIINIENEYPFQKINTKQNNDYLFKVTYFENKINIDFFHALTDGNSGGEFLKEIIYRYLDLKYPEEFNVDNIGIDKKILDTENAYIRNYQKPIKKCNSIRRAYRIKGEQLPKGQIAINHFDINLEDIKKSAKSKECTLSMYLVAMITYSIYEANYKKNDGKNPINICVPVSLKKYFPSETKSNFFSYMVISFNPKSNKIYYFEDVLEFVKKEFEKELKLKKILETITSDAGSTNKFFIRIVPLIIKKIAVRIGSLRVKRHFTLTFSNIGKFEVKEEYKKYIGNFCVILGPDWAEKIKCGVCSYENNLIVTFGTNIKNSLVENKFREVLNKHSISFKLENNGINIISSN